MFHWNLSIRIKDILSLKNFLLNRSVCSQTINLCAKEKRVCLISKYAFWDETTYDNPRKLSSSQLTV